MATHEPASLETTAEDDGTQPLATNPATTTEADGWWQGDASWWKGSDWRWSGWWGNRWNNQQWPYYERFSYATVGTTGAQSGATAGSALGQSGGDQQRQHQQPALTGDGIN